MTVEIPLTRGLVALVDDRDAAAVRVHRWAAMRGIRTWYAHRSGIPRQGGGYTGQLMHTFLTGWPRVDHVNGDGLDNRRANLRPASAVQNAQNSRKYRRSSSRYRGVFWKSSRRRWMAQIYISEPDGQQPRCRKIHLGTFVDERAAAHAYDIAAREHFGQFAAVNFPLPGERAALDEDREQLPAETIQALTGLRHARNRMSPAEIAEAVSRAEAGQSIRSIAAELGRSRSTIGRLVYSRHLLVLPTNEGDA